MLNLEQMVKQERARCTESCLSPAKRYKLYRKNMGELKALMRYAPRPTLIQYEPMDVDVSSDDDDEYMSEDTYYYPDEVSRKRSEPASEREVEQQKRFKKPSNKRSERQFDLESDVHEQKRHKMTPSNKRKERQFDLVPSKKLKRLIEEEMYVEKKEALRDMIGAFTMGQFSNIDRRKLAVYENNKAQDIHDAMTIQREIMEERTVQPGLEVTKFRKLNDSGRIPSNYLQEEEQELIQKKLQKLKRDLVKEQMVPRELVQAYVVSEQNTDDILSAINDLD